MEHHYYNAVHDKLLALDASDGRVLWQSTVADARSGYSETMAPQVYSGMVIVGSAGGEWPLRGFVAAYDAQTGKQVWRWNSTDPHSFAGDSWKRGGGMVWTTPAIDAKLGLVIFSTGNPNPDLYGTSRAGDNLYTDSIVALDATTGPMRAIVHPGNPHRPASPAPAPHSGNPRSSAPLAWSPTPSKPPPAALPITGLPYPASNT